MVADARAVGPDPSAGSSEPTVAAEAAVVEAPVAEAPPSVEAPRVEAVPLVDLASPGVEAGQDASPDARSAQGLVDGYESLPARKTETAAPETAAPETAASQKTTFVPEPSPDSSGPSRFCCVLGDLTPF